MCMSSAPSPPPPPAPLPPPPPAPPPPTPVDPAVKASADRNRQQAILARGRNATILTSPLGLTSAASTTGKTLLGQ